MNCPGLLQNPLEWFAAYAQGDMAFVPQNTFFVVLSQDDTGHVVVLTDISAHHKIIIQKVLDFFPVLCPLALDIYCLLYTSRGV